MTLQPQPCFAVGRHAAAQFRPLVPVPMTRPMPQHLRPRRLVQGAQEAGAAEAVARARPAEAEASRNIKAARRFAQLRRAQKLAAGASLAAALLAAGHLAVTVAGTSGLQWWKVRKGLPAGVIAISMFLSAAPLEYPALLWASAGAASACEASRHLDKGSSMRGLNFALLIAGLCSLFDGSALASQVLALQGSSQIFGAAAVAYICAISLANISSFSEVILGTRAAFSFGFPRSSNYTAKGWLPMLYSTAETFCVLEMFRSPLWRAGRLLVVVAALDKLRRLSGDAQALISTEAMELNRAVCVWAAASVIEASLLGSLSAMWARHLGTVGGSAVAAGLLSALLAAVPGALALFAGLAGWTRAVDAIASATKARPSFFRRRRTLGRYSVSELEGLYVQAVGTFYSVPGDKARKDKWDDFEYSCLKVRLQSAESTVLKLRRQEIWRQISGQEFSGEVVETLSEATTGPDDEGPEGADSSDASLPPSPS